MNASSTPVLLEPGTVLSKTYQIIRLIGRGGMGAVYMAYDTRLDIKVAVKVISFELAANMDTAQYDGVLKRFRAEARIAAKIDHPNVIRIFGFMQDTVVIEGRPVEIDYLVMELLGGRTLRDTMDVSGFEHDEEIKAWIAAYMVPILEGLEKVHGRGIIHRDIKPENFFMKDNTAKLADFGLSLGFDLPSVTDSMADVFGTMTYMAPEQFYNFKMAREPADIFAIGRILYEVAEGRMDDKIKPFKQVRLSDTQSAYRRDLNAVVMAATAENPAERIQSAQELKDRLLQLHYCRSNPPAEAEPPQAPRRPNRRWVPFVLLGLLVVAVLGIQYRPFRDEPASTPTPLERPAQSSTIDSITRGHLSSALRKNRRAEDNSVLHLIPPMNLSLTPGNALGSASIDLAAFYLSETPVTNQQYVVFLNANRQRVRVIDSDVHLDGRLVLKLSEKIRGYKPIVFDGLKFVIQDPMHSSCAVLMVTGYGAEAYARHYGLRMVRAKEWYTVMLTGERENRKRMQLPTPVLNYAPDSYGLRGINQLAEWGRREADDYVILGEAPSEMVEANLLLRKDPTKYYTDTGFRVALDAVNP